MRCPMCDSEDLCINVCEIDHCVDCNFEPACSECFDTHSVPAPDLGRGATGTCGDCQGGSEEHMESLARAQYPIIQRH